MSDSVKTTDITNLGRGDKVQVRIARTYGFEADCADSWTGYVWAVHPDRDSVSVVHNDPATITDPTPTCQEIDRMGRNYEGLDPGRTPTGLMLINSDGERYRITNRHPNAEAKFDELMRGYRVSAALELASRVQSVSYPDRQELAGKLMAAIRELA